MRKLFLLLALAGCASFPEPVEVEGLPVVNISTLIIGTRRAFLIRDAKGRLVIVRKHFEPVYEDEQPGTFRMLLFSAGRR